MTSDLTIDAPAPPRANERVAALLAQLRAEQLSTAVRAFPIVVGPRTSYEQAVAMWVEEEEQTGGRVWAPATRDGAQPSPHAVAEGQPTPARYESRSEAAARAAGEAYRMRLGYGWR